MSEGQPETASTAIPSLTINHPLTNGVAEPAQSSIEGGGLEVPIISAPPPTLISPEPATHTTPAVPRPIPKVYDIDVDKMQFKLYDKESGYLTPSDVLNDLGRIVHNTRIEPCNMEHVFKAHQMYLDFEAIIWEPQFLQDCERMAVRVRARRAAAKAEKAVAEASKAKGVSSEGSNDTARMNGHSPAASDAQATERHLKRQRSDTGPSPESEAETHENSLPKRAKLGENTMELLQAASTATTHLPTADILPDPTTAVVGSHSVTQHASFSMGQTLNPAQQAQRLPFPILPDFIVHQGLLANLRDKLECDSACLTIEQLEEVRATCLDCIWRRRADWDRSRMLGEMITAVGQYMQRPNMLKDVKLST
jgi:hypothetical protein